MTDFLCSWGCVKDNCNARYTQQNNSLQLIEERPHECDKAKHETLANRLAREKGKSQAELGQARAPYECYKQLPER